ncbi:MAG: LacI family DNA-binding transcriptional regulator [Synergistota bacterium]|nr:LacI family DNA-binding transcriptional regulator [Synergistota bacterium]
MSVTMVDVAKEAGVDKATVSRVLRGDPRISLKTRERVWEVIRRLDYKPNALARGLSEKKSGFVSIVFEEQEVPQMNKFLKGVGRILATVGKEPIVYVADDFDANFVKSRSMVHKAEGMIWIGNPPSDVSVPMVIIGETVDNYVCVSPFWSDTAEGIKKLAAGRQIAFVGETKVNLILRRELKEYRGNCKNVLWICDGSLPGGISRLIYDECETSLSNEGQGEEFSKGDLLLLFNERNYAKALGGYSLYFPSFEMGILAARLLINVLRHREVPFKNLVRVTIE